LGPIRDPGDVNGDCQPRIWSGWKGPPVMEDSSLGWCSGVSAHRGETGRRGKPQVGGLRGSFTLFGGGGCTISTPTTVHWAAGGVRKTGRCSKSPGGPPRPDRRDHSNELCPARPPKGRGRETGWAHSRADRGFGAKKNKSLPQKARGTPFWSKSPVSRRWTVPPGNGFGDEGQKGGGGGGALEIARPRGLLRGLGVFS